MIVAVTGSPGSGKSFFAVRLIADTLESGKLVATNVTLIEGWERRLAKGHILRRLWPKLRRRREREFHERSVYTESLAELMNVRARGKGEGRLVVVLDEAHEWLNNRLWKDEGRGDLIGFFAQHRKLGMDIYLITQHLDSIDAQVRRLVEFHVVLRNLKRFRLMGIPLIPINLFLAIWIWAAGPQTQRHIAKRHMFRLDWRRKLYDTFGLHQGLEQEGDGYTWLPRVPDAHPPQAAARPHPGATKPDTTPPAAPAPGREGWEDGSYQRAPQARDTAGHGHDDPNPRDRRAAGHRPR